MEAQTYATDIVKKLVKAGYIAYFAGGWVRDHLMGHPSDDIDIATNAPPEKILELFPRTILVGLAFGVVVVLMDGHQFEVATFRRDIAYLDGRKPEEIEFSTPEEDASRRDFTINGMFYDPIEHVIHDYVQGASDLKKGLIRTIGDPGQRFLEDRLRMVRAIRFAARFGFLVDPDTQEGIIEFADTLFPAVAMERLWQEFNKMSRYPHFDSALIEMHRLGLLPVVFPELKGVHLNDIKKRVAHFASYPANCPTILYLAELFERFGREQALELSQYLRTSNHEGKLAELYVEAKHTISSENATSEWWAHFLAHPQSELILAVIKANLPERRQEYEQLFAEKKAALHPHIERIREKNPLVSSSLLKEHGIEPGKNMGLLLKEAERLAIIHDLSDQKKVMELLNKTALWPKK